jgi:hypothetical protein
VSGIVSRGRRGSTVVPNHRWEDTELDSYDLHVAGWVASHADSYRAEYVTRNEIARRTGISAKRVSTSLATLTRLGIVSIETATHSGGGGVRWVVTFDFDAWEGALSGGAVSPTMPGTSAPADPADTSPLGETQERTSLAVVPTDDVTPREPATAALGTALASHYFDQFWAAYPRKVGKPAARRAFLAAVKRAMLLDIAEGLARWRGHWAAENRPEFIPHPATWLNQDRWDDQPTPPSKPRSKTSSILDHMAKKAEGR